MDLSIVELSGSLYASRVAKSEELRGIIHELINTDPISKLVNRIYNADLYYFYSDSPVAYRSGKLIEAELRKEASKYPKEEKILLMGLSPASRDNFIKHFAEDDSNALHYVTQLEEVHKQLYNDPLILYWRNGNSVEEVKCFVEFTNMVNEIFPLIKERYVYVKAATGLTRKMANELCNALERSYMTPIATHPDTEKLLTELELFFSKHRESIRNVVCGGSVIFEGVTVTFLNHNLPNINDVFEVSFNTKHMFF